MINLIQNMDNFILLFIKNSMHFYIMDKIMIVITTLGNGGAIWIAVGLLLAISKKYRNIGIMVLLSLVVSAILGDCIIKNLVQRLRPCAHISQSKLLVTKPLSYSFPSGHATAAFAAAGILAKYLKKYAIGCYVLASLVAFSRLYVYVHYPSDVLAGIILGTVCSRALIYAVYKIKNYKSVTAE